ncbi:MAG: hypothetical protein ACM31G_09665, partial [Flavobacteriales bacterium]
MKPVRKSSNKKKLVLGIAAISVISLAWFGKKKYDTAKEVIFNLIPGIKNVSRIRIGWTNSSFNAILTLTNPTNIDFGATLPSKIAVRQVKVYGKTGQHIGTAQGNINSLNLPANSTIALPELKFDVKTAIVAQEALNDFDM